MPLRSRLIQKVEKQAEGEVRLNFERIGKNKEFGKIFVDFTKKVC